MTHYKGWRSVQPGVEAGNQDIGATLPGGARLQAAAPPARNQINIRENGIGKETVGIGGAGRPDGHEHDHQSHRVRRRRWKRDGEIRTDVTTTATTATTASSSTTTTTSATTAAATATATATA